jgi:hypothetical protein
MRRFRGFPPPDEDKDQDAEGSYQDTAEPNQSDRHNHLLSQSGFRFTAYTTHSSTIMAAGLT